MSLSSREDAESLIGQFGLGFLSAFLLASEVLVDTLSMKPGSDPVRWHSTGDSHYNISVGDRDTVGTTVELLLKPHARFALQEEIFGPIVQKYADFLPIPIHIDGDPQPANCQHAPWEAVDPISSITDHISRSSGHADPLLIIPLSDWRITPGIDGLSGHEEITVPLRGYLYIPQGSIVSVNEFGDLRVHIRRMFICDGHRDLLPDWAKFVRGVIDSPMLQPTASREDLHRDDLYEHVGRAIYEQLIDALRRTAQQSPDVWRKIIRGHIDLILGWAVLEDEFFDAVSPYVQLKTSRGDLPIDQYLREAQNTFYFSARAFSSLQDQLLGEGNDVPVIDARWFAVRPFLEKYAQRNAAVQVVSLERDADDMLQPANDAMLRRLIRAFESLGIRASAATFKPPRLPAVLLYPKETGLIENAQEAIESGQIPSEFSDLIEDYASHVHSTSGGNLEPVLYLNTSCEFLQRIAVAEVSETQLKDVCHCLYQMTRLMEGHVRDAPTAIELIQETLESLERLMR